jgi:hypothetical protein
MGAALLLARDAIYLVFQSQVTKGASPPGVDSTVRAALITAIVTISGIILKDLVFKWVDERRAEVKTQSAIYERYSKPLAAACSSLLTRLSEILFHRHRPVYLKGVAIPAGPGSAFRAYKKASTIYRLACLMGWLRACRREFAHVRVAAKNENAAIFDAITELENALADGSWVERERIMRLSDLWKLRQTKDLERPSLDELGILVDNNIWDQVELAKVEDCELISSHDERKTFCKNVADIMTTFLSTNAIDDPTLTATWPEAFRIIAMREAWIYRDWQDAIGDEMLRRVEGEDRKFEVIGYGDFEQLLRSTDETTTQWIGRVTEVFDGVDLSIEDRFDARPRQIRAISVATAKLVKALHVAQGPESILSQHVLAIADTMLEKPGRMADDRIVL